MHFGLFGRWTALGMHFGWEWTLTRGKDWVAGNADLGHFQYETFQSCGAKPRGLITVMGLSVYLAPNAWTQGISGNFLQML